MNNAGSSILVCSFQSDEFFRRYEAEVAPYRSWNGLCALLYVQRKAMLGPSAAIV